MAIASVSDGRTALRSVTPLDITGKIFQCIENACISSSATKKFGREFPMKLKKRRK